MSMHIRHALSPWGGEADGYLSWTHEACPQCGGSFTFLQPTSSAYDLALCLECFEGFHTPRPAVVWPLGNKEAEPTQIPSAPAISPALSTDLPVLLPTHDSGGESPPTPLFSPCAPRELPPNFYLEPWDGTSDITGHNSDGTSYRRSKRAKVACRPNLESEPANGS